VYGHNVSDGGAESVGSTVGRCVGRLDGAVVFKDVVLSKRLGGTDGGHDGANVGGGVGVGPMPPPPRIRLMTGFRRSREQICVVGYAVTVGRGENDGPAIDDGYGVVVGVSGQPKEKEQKHMR
jgi:hypothetical protein